MVIVWRGNIIIKYPCPGMGLMGAVEEMGREMYFEMQCLKLDEHNIAMRVRDSTTINLYTSTIHQCLSSIVQSRDMFSGLEETQTFTVSNTPAFLKAM